MLNARLRFAPVTWAMLQLSLSFVTACWRTDAQLTFWSIAPVSRFWEAVYRYFFSDDETARLWQRVHFLLPSNITRVRRPLNAQTSSWKSKPNEFTCVSVHFGMLQGDPALSATAWPQLMQINLLTPMMLSQRCTPGMKAKRSGFILNIGSESGTTTASMVPVYAASKHGNLSTFQLKLVCCFFWWLSSSSRVGPTICA